MDYEAVAEQALSELEKKTGINYSTELFHSDHDEMTTAFQKAIKDTYSVDAVTQNGFVFLTSEDAKKESEFNNVYECLSDELFDIGSVIESRLDEAEEESTSFIQREFDLSRLTSRILNAIDEEHSVEYVAEFDAFDYLHEAGTFHTADDIVKHLDQYVPDASQQVSQDYIKGEIEKFIEKKFYAASFELEEKRVSVIKQCIELGITKEIFEQLVADITTDCSDFFHQFRDAGASEEDIAQMLANNK